ncbi:glutathione S-transferase C-terminal domain-containing protein [Spongiactinospora sp. TRM90649]|uniref:glutathione S-transferase C-terminal domain-containing protein n=1 Tax=Spongiactinospora sp. TRM90649 TaxID=3031114 RepID=UPI0023F6B713|nr:glutathione S-transferase C-terminal domain-containing protein [Spongiactinospora sp. TRM90649]MDF5758152.1 glutathione S-transferase C-terminal domain-containing protein [Spongiactinospora sp. TRM90649]
MTASTGAPVYASPADIDRYGPYGPGRLDAGTGWNRPRYPFQGRITADGSSGYPAEPGRYHVYAAWTCPLAQRVAIVRLLKGLAGVVSLSYVDDDRDNRGWAFRERRGPDPVNGFAFLQEAYDATEPGYPGHLSVPVLWDRVSGRIVSNDFPRITIDLGTAFERWGDPTVALYPRELRPEIDGLNEEIYRDVNAGVHQVAAARDQEEYEDRRHRVISALERLDERLADHRFLVGDGVTEADVRLWPTLVRFDLAQNPAGKISERSLTDFPNLWGYARDLYQWPAFRQTADFGVYRPGSPPAGGPRRITVEPFAADWDKPHGRERLGSG